MKIYSIDAQTLEWAYRKLKAYYYSYNRDNFLKDKIVQFERSWNNGVIPFEAIANKLNSEVNANNWVDLGCEVNYNVYPKKMHSNR